MRNVTVSALLFVIAACGKDAIAPPTPHVVKLIMASDTGFWRGQKLSLAGLARAVMDNGDTVAAPAVSWTLPGGFTQQSDSLLGAHEARGAIHASIAGTAVSDSLGIATLDDLSAKGTWSSQHVCYNSPNGRRGTENPPIGVDSAIVVRSNGVLTYSDANWGKGNFKAVIAVDERVISFWKDGVVDTTFGQTTIVATQDTLMLALGSNIGSAAPWMKRTSDAPLTYHLDAPGECSSDWQGGGTAYDLKATP